ncbi:MAG TPA: YdbH domain-containing protein, partial [Pseudohongiella sp.]|nr:YdbH domain-containing protein [Pseudohongiella sp.]
YQAPVLQVEIPAGLAATLATLNGPAFRLEQPALESQQPWRVNINLEDQLLVADGGYLNTTVPVLRLVTEEEGAPEGLSGFELNIERFNGSYDFSADEDATSERSRQQRLSAGFSANLEKMYTTVIPYNLWSWRWQQQLEWAPSGNLKLDSVATLDGRQVLTLGITQNFNNREGRATVNTANLNFDPGNLSLSDVLSPLPAETDLIAGELNVEANFQWQMPEDVSSFALEAWQLHGDILTEATGVAGFYEDIAFAGLNTVARWQLAPDLTLNHREPSYLSLGELDPGITLQNLHTRYHYNINARQLALQDSELQVFGGTVRTEPFVLNFAERTDRDAVDSVFNVHIEGLDISQVLSLAAYQQVSASGLIDGTLPVTLKGLTPIVNGGNFNARAPGGSIRYDSGAGMSGNQSLDLVYQALRHYQYESMLATVDYSEEGELLLGMQLQGLSPLLNNGQRINLNLNISDDVPALLQSLQAAENVSERLEDLLN